MDITMKNSLEKNKDRKLKSKKKRKRPKISNSIKNFGKTDLGSPQILQKVLISLQSLFRTERQLKDWENSIQFQKWNLSMEIF